MGSQRSELPANPEGFPNRHEGRKHYSPYVPQILLTGTTTFFNLRKCWRRSQVAKAAVCKTAIRGFDSHRRLFRPVPQLPAACRLKSRRATR